MNPDQSGTEDYIDGVMLAEFHLLKLALNTEVPVIEDNVNKATEISTGLLQRLEISSLFLPGFPVDLIVSNLWLLSRLPLLWNTVGVALNAMARVTSFDSTCHKAAKVPPDS